MDCRNQAAIKIMLVDDHQTMIWGLKQLINGHPHMHVAACALNGDDAIRLASDNDLDLIVLDMDLGGRNGLDIMEHLLAVSRAKILILTGMKDEAVLDAAVVAGARGVVRKEESAETLLAAIDKIHAGQVWIDRDAIGRIFKKMQEKDSARAVQQNKIASLTQREREIVLAVLQESGASNKVLAKKLLMGEHTLRNHLSVIYEKVGVDCRMNLYLYAAENGVPAMPDSNLGMPEGKQGSRRR